MRKLYYLIFSLSIVLAAGSALWWISRSTTFQLFGQIVPRVETQEKLVALTFDDVPSRKFTGEILRILDEEDVKATFFLIAKELEENPEGGKMIVSAGHEIGNHSYSHSRMLFASP